MKGFIEVTDFYTRHRDEAELLGYFYIKISADTKDTEEEKIVEKYLKENKVNFGQFYVKERCLYDGLGYCSLKVFVRGCDRKLINISKIQKIMPFFRQIKSKIIIGCILSVDLIGDMFVAETYEEIKQKIKEAQER